MGRMYTVSAALAGVVAAVDLISITAAKLTRIHEIRVGQTSDAGDAQAEMLGIILSRASVIGSGGSAGTGVPLDVGSPAVAGALRTGDTTQATVSLDLIRDAFNVQAGWLYLPTPETRIVVSDTEIFVARISAAPADALDLQVTMTFEEIG